MWLLPAAAPPPVGPPITPIIPINWLGSGGFPVRNDNLTNFAYVGPNDGQQQPPEVYFAYHSADPSDPSPIDPGETTYLKNVSISSAIGALAAPAPEAAAPPKPCNSSTAFSSTTNLALALAEMLGPVSLGQNEPPPRHAEYRGSCRLHRQHVTAS